jgi:hypothetical protein
MSSHLETITSLILRSAIALSVSTLVVPRAWTAQNARSQTPAAYAVAPIPVGTLLPVILRIPIYFDKSKPGQEVRGKVAQDVPLPNGSKIRKGSTVEGRITEVSPEANGTRVSLVFDRVHIDGQTLPVVTDLRAIAGFMDVLDAHIPTEAPAMGSPYEWLPTSQIGGDSVYGLRGPVVSVHTDQVIGKFTGDGVLGHVTANETRGCRGAVDGNGNPQALWVFSSDACGVYGIDHLKLEHAGRTDPKGTIVLASQTPKLQLRNGDGLLLRVN